MALGAQHPSASLAMRTYSAVIYLLLKWSSHFQLAMEKVLNERAIQLLYPCPQPPEDPDDANDSLSGLVDLSSIYPLQSPVPTAMPIGKTGPTAAASSTPTSITAGGGVVGLSGGAGGAGPSDSADPSTSTPIKPGITFSHLDLLGPVIELPDSKETPVTAASEQAAELLGTVLNIPETSNSAPGPQQPLSALYFLLAEYFGDSLAARLPVRQVHEIYVRKHPQPVVSLADADSKKSGEELLQVFLNVSGSKLDDSENVDIKSENQSYEPAEDEDIDMDKSEHSSEHSDDSTFMESNLTVKTVVGDPSTGIKLTFRMLPKIEPPIAAPVVLPPPPPPPEPEPVKKVRRKYLDEEVFEREPFLPPHLHTTFVFSYAGCVQESQPKPRTERTIFDDSHLQWSGSLLAINTKLYGRRKGSSPQEARWRLHNHTGTLYNIL